MRPAGPGAAGSLGAAGAAAAAAATAGTPRIGAPDAGPGLTQPGAARTTGAPEAPRTSPGAGGGSFGTNSPLGPGFGGDATGRTGAPAGAPSGSATMGSLPGGAQPLRAGKPRRARLVVRRIDPWSVLKFTLLFSLCLLIVFVVAVAALYYALDAMGVFDEVNRFVRELTQASSGGRQTGGVEVPFTATRVVGVAAVIGLINVVIITAISTLGAFLYNLCADIVGGIEVTLAERE